MNPLYFVAISQQTYIHTHTHIHTHTCLSWQIDWSFPNCTHTQTNKQIRDDDGDDDEKELVNCKTVCEFGAIFGGHRS